jgi:hypothetical protein
VYVGPVPEIVIDRPVLAAMVVKSRRTAAAKRSLYVPGESSPVIAPSTVRTPWRKSER